MDRVSQKSLMISMSFKYLDLPALGTLYTNVPLWWHVVHNEIDHFVEEKYTP